jgi:hypothetical protein
VQRLRDAGATLFLSLQGYDETTGQTLHTVHTYTLNDIVENARFADVLSVGEDGVRELNYRNFNEIVPLVDMAIKEKAA